jgi:hypothetical protein
MTINEWKKRFAELHKEMKEDLKTSHLEVEISERHIEGSYCTANYDWRNDCFVDVHFRM